LKERIWKADAMSAKQEKGDRMPGPRELGGLSIKAIKLSKSPMVLSSVGSVCAIHN